MSDRKPTSVLPAMVAALVVLVLYVGSFGPAWAVVVRRVERPGWFLVYAPLVSICGHATPYGNALSEYADWWYWRLNPMHTMEE